MTRLWVSVRVKTGWIQIQFEIILLVIRVKWRLSVYGSNQKSFPSETAIVPFHTPRSGLAIARTGLDVLVWNRAVFVFGSVEIFSQFNRISHVLPTTSFDSLFKFRFGLLWLANWNRCKASYPITAKRLSRAIHVAHWLTTDRVFPRAFYWWHVWLEVLIDSYKWTALLKKANL